MPQIAELFRVRQQRVMAIIALKEMEIEKRERGEDLFEDLHEDMEHVYECYEERGVFERHVRLLPTKPMFEVSPWIQLRIGASFDLAMRSLMNIISAEAP